MTDPVIPPEAVEAAAKAWHYARFPGAPWDDLSEDGRAYCRREAEVILAAALPHLRPLVEAQELRLATEVALKLGRQEAAEHIRAEIAALPTHDLEGEPIIALDVRSAASDIARRYRFARDTGKGDSA